MVVYKNTVTGRIVERDEPDPVMDAVDRWERIDPDSVELVEVTTHGQTGPEYLEVPARPEEFDPAKHAVAKVLAYLETADDAERDRVLGAERQGRNRRGILAGQ